MWLDKRQPRASFSHSHSGQRSSSYDANADSAEGPASENPETSEHDLMKALSQMSVVKLAALDEAFMVLDSGLGAIFSASMARKTAMERAKKGEGGPEVKKKAMTKKKTAKLFQLAAKQFGKAHRKHEAQEATMEMLSAMAGDSDQTKAYLGVQSRLLLTPTGSDDDSAVDSAVDSADVLAEDPSLRVWAKQHLGLEPARLEGLENSKSWRKRMRHQMLCWEAQRVDKLMPSVYFHNNGGALAQAETCSASAKAKTLSADASTSSLLTNRSSPLSIATTASTAAATHVASQTSPRTAPEPSAAFQAASRSLFGLSHHLSAQRARRSRVPASILEDAGTIEEGGAVSSRALPGLGSSIKEKSSAAPENLSLSICSEVTHMKKENPKWPGRERSLPPLVQGEAPAPAGPLTSRTASANSGHASPNTAPFSARARVYGRGVPADSGAIPSAPLSPRLDKWSSRLESCGQARDLNAGASLRLPPCFVEPHRRLPSTDAGGTPEHAYVRRCEAQGLIPCLGVWTEFSSHNVIMASRKTLNDKDIGAIIETAVEQIALGHQLEFLDLSENLLTDIGLKCMTQLMTQAPGLPPVCSGLTTLILSNNASLKFRSAAAMEDFVAALDALPSLTHLDLSNVPLNSHSTKLCAAFERCASLKNLNLSNCGLGRTDQNECVVAAALLGSKPGSAWEGLEAADFSHNYFSHASLAAAAAAMRSSRLESLSLSGNSGSSVSRGSSGRELRYHPLQLLLEGLQFNTTLCSFDLSNCGLGPDSLFVLENSAVAHPYLVDLNLSDNPLGDAGLRFLLRLLLSRNAHTMLKNVNVMGHREAEGSAHEVKHRFTQPGGIYRLNLRYPHERATLRALLRHCDALPNALHRSFKFDAKCGKPNLQKDTELDCWVIPISGSFSFTFQPPVSQLAVSCWQRVPEKRQPEAVHQSTKPVVVSETRPSDAYKKRRTFVAGGVGSGFSHGTAVGDDALGMHPVQSASRASKVARKSTLAGPTLKGLQRFVQDGGVEPVANWKELDTLMSDTRLKVSALHFPIIHKMLMSLVTQEQQLRFVQACSKDMSFNYTQVSRLCKDRPEIAMKLVCSLFPGILGCSSQLMLLSNVESVDASRVLKEVGPCLWMQSGNMTGRYELDLLKPANYAVAENCLLVNAWESEVGRLLEFPDVSQRGNFELLRNEVYNEAPFCYSRDWTLPSHGLLRFDYSSIQRPDKTMTGTHEAAEVTRYLQRSNASYDAKIRALRAVSMHLYMNTQQFKTVVMCFPAGAFRVEFSCMFHTRVTDLVRFLSSELVYNPNIFSLKDRTKLSQKVGALHLLNPLHPEGVQYRCNLAVYEERMIVEFLVQLSTEEPGGKVMGVMGAQQGDCEDNLDAFQPVPASWADKGVPSEDGYIICCYETTTVNMQWRFTLAEKYCIGHFVNP